jgi:hypothetical protein
MIDRVAEARSLMRAFADDTGLTGGGVVTRYLWTDAHAVCNFLALEAATGDSDFGRLAAALADQVHTVLGRHRPDDARSGWISGLEEEEGRRRPTAGGLRIGKPRPERAVDAPYDERAEWEQDGQYYHYLTKWMHALRQLCRATGEDRYLDWAVELARVAASAFRAPAGPPRLFWKMSIDLSYPLVPSSGLHDPLDGLVTALTLEAATAVADSASNENGPLQETITDLERMCRGGRWETGDPLGIGGLLFDAGRLAQLPRNGSHDSLLTEILDAAIVGLGAWLRSAPLSPPAWQRLGFRELGLAIGLHGVEVMYRQGLPAPLVSRLDTLTRQSGTGSAIEEFWLDPANRRQLTWADHRDISAVMLATSLLPDGFLVLG